MKKMFFNRHYYHYHNMQAVSFNYKIPNHGHSIENACAHESRKKFSTEDGTGSDLRTEAKLESARRQPAS